MTVIVDGTGTNRRVKVNESNQIEAKAIGVEQSVYQTELGRGYNINPGSFTLTSDNESGLLYIRNNSETRELLITAFVYMIGKTTGGSSTSDLEVKIYRNPTTGTLISDAVTATAFNRNFSSSKSLAATIYKGGEGKTITDGTIAFDSLLPNEGTHKVAVPVVLSQGNSVGVSIIPKSGNTNQKVQIALNVLDIISDV